MHLKKKSSNKIAGMVTEPQMENIHCAMGARPPIAKYISKEDQSLFTDLAIKDSTGHIAADILLTSMLSPPLCSAQRL